MALTKCKECRKEVSTKAKTCPHCGTSSPGVGTKELAVGLFAIAVVAALGFSACSSGDDPDANAQGQPDEQNTEQAAAQAAECRQDIQCWGQKHWAGATNRCQGAIERQAKYEVKWTDEYPDLKLSRRGWLDKDEGTLTYYGDRVQFSNGYGAFQNHAYSCDYDPTSKTVLSVVVEPGRL